jgi:hypothetical protein
MAFRFSFYSAIPEEPHCCCDRNPHDSAMDLLRLKGFFCSRQNKASTLRNRANVLDF